MTRKLALVMPLTAALLLAACGGGGGGGDGTPPQAADPLAEVPASASQSVAGMMSYMDSVTKSTAADARDPVSLLNYMPPQDDQAEPMAVGG